MLTRACDFDLSCVPSANISLPAFQSDTWLYDRMFSLLRATMLEYVPDINTINTWAEPHNANGVTPNTIIDSNDEPPANNQQRMTARNY